MLLEREITKKLQVVLSAHLLVGLVIKAFASRAEYVGFESSLRRDFSGSSHTSDFKISSPVVTLPGAWVIGDWLAQCQYTVTG